MPRKFLLIAACMAFFAGITKAQSVYLPQSYQFYQKFNVQVYSTSNSLHTSLRPFLLDSSLTGRYNELMNVGVKADRKNWFGRKLLNEHLLQVDTKDYTFYADILIDNVLGKDFKDDSAPSVFKPFGALIKTPFGINTRGFQIGGTIGSKFSFYTSAYENQAIFPRYYNNYVNASGFVPGQAYDRSFGKPQKDYSYVTALLSYTASKNLNVTVGQDKTFIGDGYRSLLLSDFAANYPMLRATANIGPVQYMMMWTYLQDIKAPKFDDFGSNRRKYALYHYLDWNATKSLSLGFFNAVVTPEADDQGNRHGFDANFINPLFFTGGGKASTPNNVLLGFTGKYKIFNKNALYAQILLDNQKAAGGASKSSNGYQVGVRGGDLGGVKNLSYLFEFNTVKPYTYTDANMLSSYTFYGDPLAHPLGANFREFVGLLNYSIGRLDFQGQLNYAKYGLDGAGENNGQNINAPYAVASPTAKVGQGIATDLYYAEGTVSFLVNPKYNLRFELGGLYRIQKNDIHEYKNAVLTFGVRTTFRNLYHDF
nr:gliding motility protein RemB [uncultured Mucilaginibacter sp.]